jgi:hypothetical protein
MTHTPGPWILPHFADDATKCNCKYVFCEAYMGAICTITVDNGENDAPPSAEAIANARLIIAAPDLLAALKRSYVFASDSNCTYVSDPRGNEDSKKSVLLAIKAAIQKAEGNA